MIRSFKSQHLHSESIDSDILLLVMHNSFTTHQVLLCNNHVSPAHAVIKFYDLLFHPVDILQRMQGNTSNCCFPCSESAGSHSPWSVAYFRKAILMATSIEVDPLSEKKTLSAHPATNGQTSKSQPIDQFSFVAGWQSPAHCLHDVLYILIIHLKHEYQMNMEKAAEPINPPRHWVGDDLHREPKHLREREDQLPWPTPCSRSSAQWRAGSCTFSGNITWPYLPAEYAASLASSGWITITITFRSQRPRWQISSHPLSELFLNSTHIHLDKTKLLVKTIRLFHKKCS